MANISSYLNTIRTATSGESVRTAIANALTAINQDNPVTVQGKTITANGTYTAEGGIAFNPVTVQVPDGGAKDYNFIDIEIVENGEYPKAEDKAKNTYYDKVTVAVPQFANDLMEERKITKNGEYEALLDGYDGYAKVIVDVSGIDTDTFTCTFVDENGTPLRTVPNIPSGGWCSDNGLRPASATGKPFQGWNPAPNDIRYNIICKPTYYEPQRVAGEIQDDWATIVANKGKPYAIGAYKTLPLIINGNETMHWSPDYHFDEWLPEERKQDLLLGLQMPIMMKVANGEDVSTSTWLSVWMGVGPQMGPFIQRMKEEPWFRWIASWDWPDGVIYGETTKRFGWSTCSLRYYLNGPFLNTIPDYIRQGIVPVTKSTTGNWGGTDNHMQMDKYVKTRDMIWIPSAKELYDGSNADEYALQSMTGEGMSYTDYLALAKTVGENIFGNGYRAVLRETAGLRNGDATDSHPNYTLGGFGNLLAMWANGGIYMAGNTWIDDHENYVQIGFCL